MKVDRSRLLSYSFAVVMLAVTAMPCIAQKTQPAANHTLDMTVVKPETVGFSSERLERLHAAMKQVIDDKELPGMVTILARHGKVVDSPVREMDAAIARGAG